MEQCLKQLEQSVARRNCLIFEKRETKKSFFPFYWRTIWNKIISLWNNIEQTQNNLVQLSISSSKRMKFLTKSSFANFGSDHSLTELLTIKVDQLARRRSMQEQTMGFLVLAIHYLN